jgi:serine protease Do
VAAVVAGALGVAMGAALRGHPPQGSGAIGASPPPPTGNPVTAVATTLLPSVVQLESNNGLGSGVVYRAGGLILTAAHVVGSDQVVTVRLANGTRVRGTVLGSDRTTDVAVVRARRHGMTVASLAVGVDVDVGQLAVAIGSPFGLQSTVTAGVVSTAARAVRASHGAVTMIQTDAPINPGNSGGALADDHARVIGINDLIRSRSGVNAGVGFAIPIDVAVDSARALLAGHRPPMGYLGVSGRSPSLGRAGAVVTHVEAGSPAAAAGIRPGDLITAIAGRPVGSPLDVAAIVRTMRPGTRVSVDVWRHGTSRRVVAVIEQR